MRGSWITKAGLAFLSSKSATRDPSEFRDVSNTCCSLSQSPLTADTMTLTPPLPSKIDVSFSHIQIYVDDVKELSAYKEWEDQLNKAEKNLSSTTRTTEFVPQNRDLVRQLLACGFRVTGYQDNDATRALLVTSRDAEGVQFLISSPLEKVLDSLPGDNRALSSKAWKDFMLSNAEKQGIGVLAFRSPQVNKIHQRYLELHPDLIAGSYVIDGTEILEVYAYYLENKKADKGTILRFVHSEGLAADEPFPGLKKVKASFPDRAQAAYCDHWVSNVFNRNEFLDTLHDTLGFTPKVDFNAGVVAAGEAQIESTVTGNEASVEVLDPTMALRDQSQVYLPINNALSEVGHVHGFLKELGQGVQHIASRVDDLVAFVQRANEIREATGEGVSFLGIPRSYYGILRAEDLEASCGPEGAEDIVTLLRQEGILSKDAAVNLDASPESLAATLSSGLDGDSLEVFEAHTEDIVHTILRSRYTNLYKLLRDEVSEETYMGIVRNKILVDIQGKDLLYQIFTSNILQRKAGEEAPFLEFIQRVCSAGSLRPGCGGFGIRNFLTLFLSIELSKAMNDYDSAQQRGDEKAATYALAMVDCFTEQLNESNPILTAISDAMTEEGVCKVQLEKDSTQSEWVERMQLASQRKQEGNERLMACSQKFSDRMKCLKEEHALG